MVASLRVHEAQQETPRLLRQPCSRRAVTAFDSACPAPMAVEMTDDMTRSPEGEGALSASVRSLAILTALRCDGRHTESLSRCSVRGCAALSGCAQEVVSVLPMCVNPTSQTCVLEMPRTRLLRRLVVLVGMSSRRTAARADIGLDQADRLEV
jgi:hypothetical protein